MQKSKGMSKVSVLQLAQKATELINKVGEQNDSVLTGKLSWF